MSRRVLTTLILGTVALLLAALTWLAESRGGWRPDEIALLRSLWIGSLPPLPPDPSNAVADHPAAARLGRQLFFDPRLSRTGTISCATCHQPERRFTDGLTHGRGLGESSRNTPSIAGAAYSPWLYWDGRRDSLWSQALSPLEDPREHGFNRVAVARLMARDPDYRRAYESLFDALPDLPDNPGNAAPGLDEDLDTPWRAMAAGDRHAVNRVFANVGKSLAAYERQLLPTPSRFDAYVEALLAGDRAALARALDADEVAGLRLFIGRGQCVQCHNGPLLTNHEFHNTGVLSAPGEVPDTGRAAGLRQVRADPFNCLGPYSDDPQRRCPELSFARSGPELLGAMRTPSLRNLAGTAPYQHKGQIPDLAGVLDHYNRAPMAMIGHNEAKPLSLTRAELEQLEAFLNALAAPLAGPLAP